jgi:hypothetical protein
MQNLFHRRRGPTLSPTPRHRKPPPSRAPVHEAQQGHLAGRPPRNARSGSWAQAAQRTCQMSKRNTSCSIHRATSDRPPPHTRWCGTQPRGGQTRRERDSVVSGQRPSLESVTRGVLCGPMSTSYSTPHGMGVNHFSLPRRREPRKPVDMLPSHTAANP